MTAESFPTPTFGSSIEYVNVLSSSSSLICFFFCGYKYIRCRLFFIFGPLASVYDGKKTESSSTGTLYQAQALRFLFFLFVLCCCCCFWIFVQFELYVMKHMYRLSYYFVVETIVSILLLSIIQNRIVRIYNYTYIWAVLCFSLSLSFVNVTV